VTSAVNNFAALLMVDAAEQVKKIEEDLARAEVRKNISSEILRQTVQQIADWKDEIAERETVMKILTQNLFVDEDKAPISVPLLQLPASATPATCVYDPDDDDAYWGYDPGGRWTDDRWTDDDDDDDDGSALDPEWETNAEKPGYRDVKKFGWSIRRWNLSSEDALERCRKSFGQEEFSVNYFKMTVGWAARSGGYDSARDLLESLVDAGHLDRAFVEGSGVRYSLTDVGRETTPGAMIASLRDDVREFIKPAIFSGWKPTKVGTRMIRFSKTDVMTREENSFLTLMSPANERWRELLAGRMDKTGAPHVKLEEEVADETPDEPAAQSA
jgi:hypothetical protein